MQHETRQALAGVRWIHACGDTVIDRLAAGSRLERVPDGKMVAWRGKYTGHLLVVACGALEVSISSAAGKRHVVSRTGPGKVFGLIPVLDHSPWIHDATAKGPTVLVSIPRDTLLDAMHDHAELSAQVVQLLCARSRKLYETLAAQSLLSLPARVARVVAGLLDEATPAVLAMAQADLADMLGVTRQSLNVELRQMAFAGIIALGRNRIEVLDLAALERLGGMAD